MNFRKTLALSLLAPAFLAAGVSALGTPTHNHAVTLLADGNILVTGGRTAINTVSNRVEMYNMATNLWEPWVNLVNARSSHTATLMSDGRVLVAGGFIGTGAPTASMEICDPKTAQCVATMNLTPARGGHTAVLLTAGDHAGEALICGGQSGDATTITNTCDYVDSSGLRTEGPSMVSARVGHAAALLHSGRVFVSGGKLWDGSAWVYQPMNEMYDPGTGAWTPVDSLNQGRMDHTVTVLNNGKIMIAGGFNGSNRLRCMYEVDSLEEDCWHSRYFSDPGVAAQGPGNRGYLDGAEFFDQNGARVTLMEDIFNLMPYRTSRHTAVLETDGRWRTHRGYGNIYPTFFTASPSLANTGTIIRLATVAGSSTTATVRPDSDINFPLEFKLVRPVSGRLVEADLFISSSPSAETPSITLANAKFSLGRSTVIADGIAVGKLLGEDYAPGDFNAVVSLNDPGGTAVFDPVDMDIDEGAATISSNFNGAAPIYPEGEGAVTAASLQVSVSFELSDIYRSRVQGAATLVTAELESGDYSITLDGGVAPFNFTAGACNDIKDLCTFAGTLDFSGVTGTLTNLTTLEEGTTFFHASSPAQYQFPMNVGALPITLTLELNHTANEVHIRDKTATYAFDRSTAVIRGMIFSNHLAYTPRTNRWSDLADSEASGLHSAPSLDHTATYTPAGDTLMLGGRNCETATPTVACARPGTFTPGNNLDYGLIPVVEGNWTTGGKLGSRRAFHTSTLLSDGKILTCGGTDGASPLATCELLDPATTQWKLTGAMNSPRANYTATLLPNGNVLAAGGITPGGAAVASAEIFYPQTQTWVPTGAMSSVRQLHTATLMPDGNVLVTGGATTGAYSSTAEIYITSAAHWVTGGNLNLAAGRSQHTATLLKSGLVLIAGGINGLGSIASAELYNYLARTSVATATMNYPRFNHTANLLRDGRVLVAGGSDGSQSSRRTELYTAAGTWVETSLLNFNRASHRTVLLPNGKVMLTGGDISGVVQSVPESFDPDLPSWSEQGESVRRSRHTSVLTRNNRIINIGGWDGGNYLDTTDYTDFNFWPDSQGLLTTTTRQPLISTGTTMFDHGWRATLLSATSNFHGITEAAGGGTGPMNSSHSNPRVYMQQIDNPSGFMIDLSTRIYSHYDGPNTDWSRTLSSITVIMPSLFNEMPRGWYHMRVAANGVFSDGFAVQVTTPRPTGSPSVPTAVVQGISSITWTWDKGDIPVGGADGFAVYSASNSVFITTVAFANMGGVSYTQTDLAPNTPASIMVSAYNQGGYGGLARSGTYYTLAAPPADLTITDVNFETVTLTWSANGNTPITRYELSMAQESSDFSVRVSTPVGFDDGFTSTTYTVTGIEADNLYYFRVRARNGDGIVTLSTPTAPPYVSTVTVGQVQSLQGTPLSGYEISWAWIESGGADYYEIYDVSSGTDTAVLISSPVSVNSYTQTNLSTNTVHRVIAYAVKTTGYGPVRGSPGYSPWIYTLANPPEAWSFTGVSTNTITLRWQPNGNPSYTSYVIHYSSYPDFAVFASTPVLAATNYPVSSLVPNTVYYARVHALNGNGVPTASVSLGSKYTHAQPPTDVTAAQISMSGVTLIWNQGENPSPTYYEVRGSTDNFVTVSTHVLFAQFFTESTVTISGLLTSTTYQFDVAARNGENVITARTRVVPSVFTLAGPTGTPSGAIGGTGVPGVTSVIEGVLPNGHRVSMSVPPDAFQTETAIAIASHSVGIVPYSSNPCNQTVIPVIAMDIYSEGGTQPFEPVELTIGYTNLSGHPDFAKIAQNVDKLVWARYNPVNSQCLPLETEINLGQRLIKAYLNHFSTFQLVIKEPSSNLSGVLIYPNPFYPNRGQGFVTFNNLPAATKVNIYTLSGTKVWEGTATNSGVLTWRGVNESGNPVGSGVYFVSVKSTGGDKIFKLAVER